MGNKKKISLNALKRSEKPEKKKIKLSDNERLFVISLYPKGRNEEEILAQLRDDVFRSTSERILLDRMGRWIKKLHDGGMVTRIPTEGHGVILSLTKDGVKYARKKIEKMFYKNIDKFTKIFNRLSSGDHPDSWSLKLVKSKAEQLVAANIPFFTVVFFPQRYSDIIKSLKEYFGIDLSDDERYQRFKRIVEQMNVLQLIDISNHGEEMMISSTHMARNILSGLHVNEDSGDHKKYKKYKKKYKKARHDEDDFERLLIISTIVALCISFLIMIIAGGLGAGSMWWLSIVAPILVPVVYFIYIYTKKKI